MSRRAITLAAAVALILAGAAALVLSLPHRDGKGGILVMCGASMRAPVEEIVRRYTEATGERVLTSYGDSGALCAQISRTGLGDIYICHDPFMPWAAERGLIERWQPVARLEIVIVVPKGNPRGIARPEDLAQPGLRLGMGDETYSTSGVMVKEMLKRLPCGEEIRRNIRMETKGHQQRCNDVALGTLDAAVVWNAVAHVYRDRLDAIPIAEDYVDAVTSATYKRSDLRNVRVTVGVLACSRDKERAVRFHEFVTTRCADLFRQYGFSPVRE